MKHILNHPLATFNKSSGSIPSYQLTACDIKERNGIYTVNFGVSFILPPHTLALLCTRYTAAEKHNITLVNGINIIDTAFKGPLIGQFVSVTSNAVKPIQPGDMFAKIVFVSSNDFLSAVARKKPKKEPVKTKSSLECA